VFEVMHDEIVWRDQSGDAITPIEAIEHLEVA
jgi:hypothetical protein